MIIPFWLPEGHVLAYGDRDIRFEEGLGDGILRFRYADGNEEIVRVPVGAGGELGLPTVDWMITQFRAGNVVDRLFNGHVTRREKDVLHLDRPACLLLDKKAGWRFDWADAANLKGFKKTEAEAKAWIATATVPGPKPQSRSLLRWMRTLRIHGGRIGALVSTAGREKGQSQLPDVEDRLVHKWAMRFWRPTSLNGRFEHKEDAAAMVAAEWDILVELGVPYLSDECPSAETVRKRINSLECYSTHASRFGRPAADKMFAASGEPVPIERPFERMFMDGVEWEHSVHYSDDLKIPAAKMKSVITMDGFSQWVAPHPTFAGEFRPQWGLCSLRNVMMPPTMTEEKIQEDPELAMFYGIPSDVMYDRDRTMISPRMVPGAIQIFATAEIAEAYHSDAKAKLENYHKFVKAGLAKIPGRILGARDKYHIGYDPLAATELTRRQYVDLIEQSRRLWNSAKKTSMGNRSPNDIMRAFLRTGAMRLADPKEVMRTFASTPSKPCVLTTNGLIYDNVHYRFNREDVSTALSSNYRNTSFAKRLTRTARLEVSIRVWDDDIDMIEVFDVENKGYFPMWSIDPGYTGGLNRWEHHLYQKHLRSGGGGGGTKRDRLRNKAKHLEERQRTLTGKSFRERGETVELLEAEERRMSGRRGRTPGCATVPELSIPTTVDGTKREDAPMPPPQGKAPVDDAEGADDVRSDPSKAIARQLGDDEAVLRGPAPSWDFNDDAEDDEDEED
jgi:hypothetical protein